VRIEIRGEPLRVGVCHCLACRKETGSSFKTFGVWRQPNVTIRGETKSLITTTEHRQFCPVCGSHICATHDFDDEIDVGLGVLDNAPSDLTPSYELWIPRRERWLKPVEGTVQYVKNRPEP